MNQSRAKEIWETRTSFGSFTYTEEENAIVNSIWETMGGNSRWVDALLAIAKGEVKLPLKV